MAPYLLAALALLAAVRAVEVPPARTTAQQHDVESDEQDAALEAILAARCVRGRARERCPATDGDLNALIYFSGGHCAGLVVVRGRGCELVLFL